MIVAFRASPRRWTLLLPSGAPIWGQAAPSSGGSWRLKGRSTHGQLQGSRPQCGHLAGRQLSPRCPHGGRGHLHPDQLCGGRERGPPISGALRRCRSPPSSASTPRSSAPANCAATARFSRCLSVAEIRARFTLCGCSQAVGRSGAVLHQRARPPTCRERGTRPRKRLGLLEPTAVLTSNLSSFGRSKVRGGGGVVGARLPAVRASESHRALHSVSPLKSARHGLLPSGGPTPLRELHGVRSATLATPH